MSAGRTAERSPSIRDVAIAAGVSHQTVSRVLNGHSGIRPDTEQRVRQAIAELGWRPNRAARSLASARHGTVGLLTTARALYGPMQASIGVAEAARAGGFAYTSASTSSDDPDEIAEALAALVDHGVDGLVLVAPQERARRVLAELSAALPAVSLHPVGSGDHVSFDQADGMRDAVAHLVALGHRRIAHLPGPVGWAEAQDRLAGYLSAVGTAGVPAILLPPGDWTSDSGYDSACASLPGRDFTAVCCANDEMAIGVLHAAHELGVAVPGELSVIGFDDVPEARHLVPPLTTVRQDFVELGRQAMQVLIAEIEAGDRGPVGDVRLELTLVVRASTARPIALRRTA